MSVWVVVGGQYGSEGKGKIAAYITLRENIEICIRCGGPNSGHCFRNGRGELVALRQLPTGFVREGTRLLIPAGGLIDLALLQAEIEFLSLDPCRIGVDRNAMVINTSDKDHEKNLRMFERLSSTLCGVGAAVARRALRSPDVILASDATKQNAWLRPLITDVSAETNAAVDSRKNILIEGTQGTGLSLYHSGHYPKATSRDTTAAGFISEVGLSPRLVDEIILVFRTYPIRVAGLQAGPIREEISWAQIQKDSGSPIPLDEYTTVTGRLRRVGKFEGEESRIAARLNRPTKLALNFLDYIDYSNRFAATLGELTETTREFICGLEKLVGAPVCYMGVGPALNDILELARNRLLRPEPHLEQHAYNAYGT